MKDVMNITIKSPTRVDLAGGTIDLWPLSAFVGGGCTVNLAIDLWSEVEIKSQDGIFIDSKDLKKSWTFRGMKELLSSTDPDLRLYKELFASGFTDISDFALTTRSQSPVGGGIGGSSSLLISMLKALHQMKNQKLPPTHDLVHWAHNIEARIIGTPTGTQDYYPAVTGGLNIITYSDRKIELETMSATGSVLESHFLLVSTGKAHHSGINNFDVLTRSVHNDQTVKQALLQIKNIAQRTAEVCRAKDWMALPGLFKEEYQARVLLTPKFSSPEIEKLHALAIQNGAAAVKICGAGGGGCVLVWVEPSAREKVKEICQGAGFQVLGAKPVDPLK